MELIDNGKPINESGDKQQVTCPTCNGSGKVTFFMEAIAELGGDGNTEVECAHCEGRGKITPKKAKLIETEKNKYCQCGNPSGHADCHEKTPEQEEYWSCVDCGKIKEIFDA